jgi:hypothetical protein
MAGKNESPKKVKGTAVPKFDRGQADFFRGSRGNMFNNKGTGFVPNLKGFAGMRRGSK